MVTGIVRKDTEAAAWRIAAAVADPEVPVLTIEDLGVLRAVAVDGDPDLAVYDGEVTSAGRIELLPFVHEQAIAITAHRYGNPDDWSASVI